MLAFEVFPLDGSFHPWARELLTQRWGSTRVVSRGAVHQADRLSGFIASLDGKPAGLATYHVAGDQCEIVSLDSLFERKGIGSALIEAVCRSARKAGCRRVWLITTNDNLPALHFYQKRGFTLAALYPNALASSRKLKPEIPLFGLDGIPLRDEIELERLLTAADH